MEHNKTELKWVRADEGAWIAGVCKGLGDSFDIEAWILRALFVVGFVCYGFGILIYLLAALCLPRRDKLDAAYQKKLLGVCRDLAIRYNFEVGLVRLAACLFALSSFGLALVAYVVVYFLMPRGAAEQSRK